MCLLALKRRRPPPGGQVLDVTNGLPLPRARVELIYGGAPAKHAYAGGRGDYLLASAPAPYEVAPG